MPHTRQAAYRGPLPALWRQHWLTALARQLRPYPRSPPCGSVDSGISGLRDPPSPPYWQGHLGLSLLAGSCVCAVRGCVEPSDPGLSSTVFPCLFVFAERNKPTRASRAQQPRRRRAPSPWPPSCPPPHSSDPGSLPLAGEPTTRIGQLGWPRARSAIIQGVGSCPTPLPARVAVAAHARLAGAVPCPPLRVACPADPRAWLLLPVRGSQRTPPFVWA